MVRIDTFIFTYLPRVGDSADSFVRVHVADFAVLCAFLRPSPMFSAMFFQTADARFVICGHSSQCITVVKCFHAYRLACGGIALRRVVHVGVVRHGAAEFHSRRCSREASVNASMFHFHRSPFTENGKSFA